MTAQNSNQTHFSNDLDLFAVNDHLSNLLADKGWTPETDEDYDKLNDLTHEIGEKVSTFLNNNS